MIMTKEKDQESSNNRVIITAPITKSHKPDALGKPSAISEFYINRSIQDYYIKFCESSVSLQEFESKYDSMTNLIITMRLEVTFKSGNWDNCPNHPVDGDRHGEYVVLHQIVE